MKGLIFTTLCALALVSYGAYKYTSSQSVSTYADRLNSIADKVNSMNTTWKAGHNKKFENVSKEHIKSLLMDTSFLHTGRSRNGLELTHNLELTSVPESFDSRTEWPGCKSIGEIRDQSACGSCWAHGAAEAMSDRICIHSDQKIQTRVSAEDLMECCSSCGYGCNGGFPMAAWEYWRDEGIASGGVYGETEYCKPYKFAPCAHHVPAGKYPACPSGEYDTPSCKRSCSNNIDQSYSESKSYASQVYSVSGEEQLKAEISKNGPVEVAFTVYEDFPTYKSGVYQHVTGEALGGHAVRMLGYGEEDGVKYWLVANSWNETWGDNGYFKIIRGDDDGNGGIEEEGDGGFPRA